LMRVCGCLTKKWISSMQVIAANSSQIDSPTART
jgi:hypothetical protein